MEVVMIKKNGIHAKFYSTNKLSLFWNVSELPLKFIRFYFNHQSHELIHVMRIYDVTDILFNGQNAHQYFEIAISYEQGNWTVKGISPNRNYIVEIGIKFSENEYFPLLRSNCVEPSTVIIKTKNETDHSQPPEWTDHVSTYSYYNESDLIEGFR
jgi:uncharacterized protein